MKLGKFVKQYREEHNLSIRTFAALAGISPQQVINIEKGVNNDGKPLSSTMKTYRKIAKATGLEEKEFFSLLNDYVTVNPDDKTSLVTISDETFDIALEERHEYINSIFDQLSFEYQVRAANELQSLLQEQLARDGLKESD